MGVQRVALRKAASEREMYEGMIGKMKSQIRQLEENGMALSTVRCVHAGLRAVYVTVSLLTCRRCFKLVGATRYGCSIHRGE